MYTDKGEYHGGMNMNQNYVADANRLFLCSIVGSKLLLNLVSTIGVRDAMALQLLIEVFMALPCVFYLVSRRESFITRPEIYKMGAVQWILLLPLALCVDKIAEFVNVFSQLFTQNQIANHMLELVLQYPFPVAFFVIAVVPAVCEELIYRVVLYRGYRRSSALLAVLLTAFLFGIMHMNLNQFSYAFILGILFALINEAAGSVLPSVVLHLYINGRSVVLLYTTVNFLEGLREQYIAAKAAGNTELMQELSEQANGVPIQKEDWLNAFMMTDNGDVLQSVFALLPYFLIAVIGVMLIICFLFRSTGRKGLFREMFQRKGTGYKEERAENKLSFLTPSLLVGCAFCIAYMIL